MTYGCTFIFSLILLCELLWKPTSPAVYPFWYYQEPDSSHFLDQPAVWSCTASLRVWAQFRRNFCLYLPSLESSIVLNNFFLPLHRMKPSLNGTGKALNLLKTYLKTVAPPHLVTNQRGLTYHQHIFFQISKSETMYNAKLPVSHKFLLLMLFTVF